jgi:hypothetical protein
MLAGVKPTDPTTFAAAVIDFFMSAARSIRRSSRGVKIKLGIGVVPSSQN